MITSRRREAGGLLASLIATAGATAVALQPWRVSIHVPYTARDDALGVVMGVKNVVSTGWYQTSGQLNAPFGQQLYGYPSSVGDTFHFLMIRFLALFTSEPAVIVNVYYLLGFLVTGGCAYASFRMIGLRISVAATLAPLYAVLPYHVLQGEVHLLLSAYYCVPLVAALVIRQRGDRPLAQLRPGAKGWRRVVTGGNAAALGIVLLASACGLYYALFTVLLVISAGLSQSWTLRHPEPLLVSLALAGAVLTSLVLASLPTLAYLGSHGPVLEGIGRSYEEVEIHGARLASMLLPDPQHRIAALGAPARAITAAGMTGEKTDPLGLLAAAGLLVLFAIAVLQPFRKLVTARGRALASLSGTTVLCFVVGTVAGLGAAAAAASGIYQIRTWSRINVFIAFFALAAIGYGLETVGERMSRCAVRPWWAVLLGSLLVLGVLDQTNGVAASDYGLTSSRWSSDANFFGHLDAVLPGGTAVFQLPYIEFPEGVPIGGVRPYEPLRAYVHSQHLRWSYGGVKGRETQWQPQALSYGERGALPQLAIAGFGAVVIDRRGVDDHGRALEAALTEFAHAVPLGVDSTGELSAWDIREYAARVRAALGSEFAHAQRLVLHPVVAATQGTDSIVLQGDVLKPVSEAAKRNVLTAHTGSIVLIRNDTGRPRRIVLTVNLLLTQVPSATVTLTWSGGSVLARGGGTVPLNLVVNLLAPPGDTPFVLSTDATEVSPVNGKARASMVLMTPEVVDRDLVDLLAAHGLAN